MKAKKNRIVIDTNVVISILLFGGELDEIRKLWQLKKIFFLVSKEVVEEYIKVLAYPKFSLTDEKIKFILEEEILPFVTTVRVKSKITHVKDDPDDDKFLALAVDGNADYIITGDKHLLNLKEFQTIKIITVKEFLAISKSL
jgi:putative PIN family toxin of toxin-antitoxin system